MHQEIDQQLDKQIEQRIDHSTRLLIKYPERVPVIIEKNEHITLENYKYLLPKAITFCTFMSIIKTKINIASNQALFTFIKSNATYVLIPMNENMGEIYKMFKQPDGFLYIRFGIENTFG